MFVRADTLLRSGEQGGGKHVIHFGWEDFQPMVMLCDHKGEVANMDLGGEIDWTVSENKRCVGSFGEDGYHRCPEAMPVRRFDQCSRCSSTWIGRQDCVFEPQCEGGRCDSPICSREHTVYLAFFGETGKIGMTTSRRLKERGIEQGADAIVPLARFPNRLLARRAEQDTSERLRLTQYVRKYKAVRLLTSHPRADRLEQLYRAFQETLEHRMELLNEPLLMLDGYPLHAPEGREYKLIDAPGKHKGKILGLKGKFLVYDDGGETLKAMDASDLPGRFVSAKR
ncbi:MAG: hypothetical protein A4E32_00736 [Methanomassiliicoccales archaeon PtaU1.Bin124]|nr:MAG: hypothetical protein A4E32_00736 [Methanomassiliicoccales archaeon PtaU1.Bin124]